MASLATAPPTAVPSALSAATWRETPLLWSARKRGKPMRLLPPGTQLELAHSPQQTAEGLVSVVTAEGEAGWVQRGALRLRHDGIRRASHRRLATLDGSDGLGLADWSHPFFFVQMADPQRTRYTSPTARMRARRPLPQPEYARAH